MHKHNWCIYFAETEPKVEITEEEKSKKLNFDYKCGCKIVCSICGKEKNRLARKINQYYVNVRKPLVENFIRGKVEIYTIKRD